MLKINHLQTPNDGRHLHDLAVSLKSAISSCSDHQFGLYVSMEIRGILEKTERRIQRVLDKNFAVKPEYHVITCPLMCYDDKNYAVLYRRQRSSPRAISRIDIA